MIIQFVFSKKSEREVHNTQRKSKKKIKTKQKKKLKQKKQKQYKIRKQIPIFSIRWIEFSIFGVFIHRKYFDAKIHLIRYSIYISVKCIINNIIIKALFSLSLSLSLILFILIYIYIYIYIYI